MKVVLWNVRGATRNDFIPHAWDIIATHKPSIFIILEAKSNGVRALEVSRMLGFDGLRFIEPNGSRGGIWLMFNAGVELILYNPKSINFFHALFKFKPHNTEVLLTGIHAPSNPSERHRMWNNLKNDLPPDDTPWLVLGDLNEVTSPTEKMGGRNFRMSQCQDLNMLADAACLVDLGFNGNPYTWHNAREGAAIIRERLDRAMANPSWLNNFPNTQNPLYYIDHELSNFINDIVKLLQREWSVTILHVKRQSNKLAHGLAQIGRLQPDDDVAYQFFSPSAFTKRLRERHVRDNGVCELCNAAPETICHAIFDCPNVRLIWEPSPHYNILLDAPKTSFKELFLWMNSKLNKEELLSVCALAWAAWSYRNSVVFNNPWKCVMSGAVGYLKLVGDYKKYNEAVGCARASIQSSPSSWQAPADGIKINPNNTEVLLTGIHAPSNPSERHRKWNNLKNDLPPDDTPWLVLGDLNEVTSPTEKMGGRNFRMSQCQDLNMLADAACLVDLGFNGNPYTWHNAREGAAIIRERLDRAMANPSWLNNFPNTQNPLYYIDHELSNFINDIVKLLQREWSVTILHVKRQSNKLAHGLAQIGRLQPDDDVAYQFFSPSAFTKVYMDELAYSLALTKGP
uniref:RNase H type-1 domain-containing protein n=1 Tax=Chenopodium quinoa TaxID=63459 RepID=A0A803LUB2_CHEQI